MQKGIRFNDSQLLYLASKARQENTISGFLYKKSSDLGKWQLRWFVLYQNLLMYFESDSASRPSGVALLEGSYCDRAITPAAIKGRETEKQYCFTITYKSEGQRQYDLRSDSEAECNAWIDAIKRASYSKVLEQKEELEQKHLHLLQILDSERQAKWQYVQQTGELAAEVKKLKEELQQFKKEVASNTKMEEETDELKKIKKVQSFFRGWLCRRRWKQIVELYIRSPHAESMRKRNSIVFSMVECEEEYNRQLSCLVTCFLRPLRMAASSKKPPVTHEDVNSIFLNSETLLFLHQIFLKGLSARLENWPTLVLGDLFDMLLPMLSIYQEYVRNHHYSLQVLAEYKQKHEFNALLKRYEEKPACEGRSLETFLTYPMHQAAALKQKFEQSSIYRHSHIGHVDPEKGDCQGRTLETFLTYPMHQIPRYIITLHELLAHTPHDHVERESLEYAKSKLEELSRVMHDEVSETENIRKNLAIERMIIEGCDILLDVNQTFVRQGPLLQVLNEKTKSSRNRLGSFSSSFKEKKEIVRQVFLFTNHVLLTTRTSSGRLHLAKDSCPKNSVRFPLKPAPAASKEHYGKITLLDCTLVEDPNSDIFYFDEETSSVDSNLSLNSQNSAANLLPNTTGSERECKVDYNGLDFRLIVDTKSGPPINITLVASTLHEKAAWCSDISQCIENLHYSDLLNSSMSESSSVTMPQSVRFIHSTQIWSDPKLFRDDVDIKFSRTLNSCKVPQIRHASVDRLLDRLTDLRFLSIDFLNTFLLTYRVFTTGHTLLDALKKVYKSHDTALLDCNLASRPSISEGGSGSPPHTEFTGEPPEVDSRYVIKPHAEKLRRVSTGCMKLENEAPAMGVERPLLTTTTLSMERGESVESDDSRTELSTYLSPSKPKLAPIASCETLYDHDTPEVPAILTSDSSSAEIILLDYEIGESVDTCDNNSSDNEGVGGGGGGGGVGVGGSTKLVVPAMNFAGPTSASAETLVASPSPLMSSAVSSDTLTPGTPRSSPLTSPSSSPKRLFKLNGSGGGGGVSSGGVGVGGVMSVSSGGGSPKRSGTPSKVAETSSTLDALALSPTSSPIRIIKRPMSSPVRIPSPLKPCTSPKRASSPGRITSSPGRSPLSSPKTLRRAPSPISYSYSSPNIMAPQIKIRPFSGKRGSVEAESITISTPRSSFQQIDGSPPARAKAGTVVTSSRASKRRVTWFCPDPSGTAAGVTRGRSSSSAATTAFAAATAGHASCMSEQPKERHRYLSVCPGDRLNGSKLRYLKYVPHSEIGSAATMRVVNILKNWILNKWEDFESDTVLRAAVTDLLEEMVCNSSLLPAEHKAAASILRTISRDTTPEKPVDLEKLLVPLQVPSRDSFDTLSALDIAEQLTYLDHQIFIAIRSEELLSQAWMKPDKSHKAPHVLLVSKRFNEVSRLVVSEIVGRSNMADRVSCIEKWAAIADICRCMHNYNGVLQICAAFVNSSVYRLKKTWEKLSKQTKQMIERLQTLVSSEGRFKNMRDALHRCDPPCIPYLGMYLTDLSFIEEGTPNFTEEKLVNFSKMRMIAHVIREIRLFQQTSYKIEHHPRVTNYLLDPTRLYDEEQTYKASLEIEPKQSRLSMVTNPS